MQYSDNRESIKSKPEQIINNRRGVLMAAENTMDGIMRHIDPSFFNTTTPPTPLKLVKAPMPEAPMPAAPTPTTEIVNTALATQLDPERESVADIEILVEPTSAPLGLDVLRGNIMAMFDQEEAA